MMLFLTKILLRMIVNKKLDRDNLQKIKVFFTDVDGTLTDGITYYSVNGETHKGFNHKDGRGVYLLKKNNIQVGIITGENSKILLKRAEKLKIDICYLNIENKLKQIKLFCEEFDVKMDEIAYIGDDTNDLELLKEVGVSFAVNDCVPKLREIVNFICENRGGYGAFREAAEFLIEPQTIIKK